MCSRVTESQKSDHLGTLQTVEKVIQKMEAVITNAGMKDVKICIKAGMHTGLLISRDLYFQVKI